VEGLLDVLQADALADEAVEGQPPLEVQVDEQREVAARQAVAVPRRLEGAAPAEVLDHRQIGEAHVGRGHADLDDGAGEVASEERLLEHLRVADGFDAHVGAEPSGGGTHGLDRIGRGSVDGVGGAERPGPFELAVVEVDGDDGGGAGEHGAGDRRVADPATAEHGDAVAALHVAGVHRRADAGHDPATEQPGDRRVGLG
jgi:hypothetical protein